MSDLRYHPVYVDIESVLASCSPERLLVLGHDVPAGVTKAEWARIQTNPEVLLPSGIYQFETSHELDLLCVPSGAAPGPPSEASWDAADDHPLVEAFNWFSHLWVDAMAIPRPQFNVGDEVTTVAGGQEGSVRGRDFSDGMWWYRVRVEGRTINVAERGLAPPRIDDDPFEWILGDRARAERFCATLTRAKLSEELTDTVYSYRATRTIFRPYQFRPVMRLLSAGRSLRLLVADEVGLGKTIEAGLVWTELDARHQANRVLVVCPSMLVPKWRGEMLERFGYDLIELTKDNLEELLERAESDRIPTRYRAVCSLERLRIWDGLDRLAEIGPRFDLIIFDEAHALRNAGTRSHALGAQLADWADALVFLSATPLNLGNDDLYNLLELLAPGEFDDRYVLEERLAPNAFLNRISASLFDRETSNSKRLEWLQSIEGLTFGPTVVAQPEFEELRSLLSREDLTARDNAAAKRLISRLHSLAAVVTRTRKVEIQEHKAVREARSIQVQWTPAEAEFYFAFEQWQRARARRKGLPIGFVTQMPLRLASSCLPAARDRVLSAGPNTWNDDDFDSSVDELDGLSLDDVDDLPPPEVVQLASRLGDVDSKFDSFLPDLRAIVGQQKRVIVFTFSRAALAYLTRRLADVVRIGVLHGDVPRDDRHNVIQRFRAHEFDVLLASRVASEGLDFEFCSAIVNWDLPWNPMEVEQRIGRIDRIGQVEDKVVILNFHTPGTIESDIIERVHQRIGVFEDSIGELEPILQSRLSALRNTMFNFALGDEERARRLDEMLTAIEELRLTEADLESARSYLSSTDKTDIEGFERDLIASGRYVGQRELVLLMEDWVAGSPEARCEVSSDGRRLLIVGSPKMEEHLRGVQAAGERSSAEIDRLARSLRDGDDIHLCLDQELARTTGQDLLNSNHPLVRAALRVPGFDQARIADVTFASSEAPTGSYLILLAVARWSGARPANEFWTAAVDLMSPTEASDTVGDAMLAALAEGGIEKAESPYGGDLTAALRVCERRLRRRQEEEEDRRTRANESLVETRRISLRETHARKVEQIQRRIATLRRDGKYKVIRLQEAQLANQTRLLEKAELELDAVRNGSMSVEHVAVCLAHVTS